MAPMEVVVPFVTVRMTIAGQPVQGPVDSGSSDSFVLFKTRMPAGVADTPWRGDKTVQYASGPARLRRLDLRRVGLGENVWARLPAWALDWVPRMDIRRTLTVCSVCCRSAASGCNSTSIAAS